MRQMVLGVTALVMACSGYDPTGVAGPGPGGSSAVASVTIEPLTASLSVGSTLRLKVILHDAAGRELANRTISFTSSDDRVLSVDATGLVRALAEGQVTLTATSEGKSGRATIAVVPAGDACAGCWDYSPVP